MGSEDDGDFGVTRTSLIGVVRAVSSRRSTYIAIAVTAVACVGLAIVLNWGSNVTATVRESGLNGVSVSIVITGKEGTVHDDEAQVSSDAALLKSAGVTLTTMSGDAHLGTRYCQFTFPGTAGGLVTIYSNTAYAGTALCDELQGSGQ